MGSTGIRIFLTILFIVAAVVVIFLLLKSVKHWSYKTDKMLGSIDDIGARIEDIEKGMDNIKISTEKLIQETQETNRTLQERPVMMIDNKKLTDEKMPVGNDADKLLEDPIADVEMLTSEDNSDLKSQVYDLEKALQELKKQKAQLESDINAKIRD